MGANTHTPLLSCSIKIPTNSFVCASRVNNNDFHTLNNILVDFCKGLRSSIKEDKCLSKIFTNITFTNDLNTFSDGRFAITFYTQVSELIKDLSIIKQSIKEFITLSIDLVVSERYYSKRSYSSIKADRPILSLHEQNKILYIKTSHLIIASIANKIQDVLVRLYNFDEDTVIEVLIDNEKIRIPGIEQSIQPTKKHKTESPEQCTAILHTGNQASNSYNFLITTGTSLPKPLTHVGSVNDDQLTKIRIKARYEDPVIVEIYQLVKDLRGITASIPDVEFVRLITDDSAIQSQLFTLDCDHKK